MKSFLIKYCPVIKKRLIAMVVMLAGAAVPPLCAQVHFSPPAYTPPVNNNWMFNFPPPGGDDGPSVHRFRVVYTDGTQKAITAVMLKDTTSYYLLYENKAYAKKDSARHQKIRPAQTQLIYRTDMEEGGEYAGIATDSCWLFTKFSGAVNAFTPSPDDYLKDSSITYLQKGTHGVLLKMSQENLESIVGDDHKALDLAKKKKYLKALQRYNDDAAGH